MKTQLNILKKASQKSALPIIDRTVLVESGQLVTTDLNTFIQVTKPDNLTVNGSGVISYDVLKSLENCKEIAITFHGFSAEIIADGRNLTIAAFSADDFPKSPEITNMMHQGRIIGQNVASVLDFLGKDDLRPAMQGAYVGSDIVGTNGHYLRWIKSSYDGEPFILRREAVEAIKEQAKTVKMYSGPAQFWKVKKFGNDVCLYLNDVQIITRAIEDTYPNYKAVIPQSNEGRIRVNVNELKSALKSAKTAYNKNTKQVIFDVATSQTLTLTADDIDLGTSVNIPITAQTQNIETGYRIGFNAEYLEKICSNVSADYLDISLDSPNRAAVINEHILLMPIMLKG